MLYILNVLPSRSKCKFLILSLFNYVTLLFKKKNTVTLNVDHVVCVFLDSIETIPSFIGHSSFNRHDAWQAYSKSISGQQSVSLLFVYLLVLPIWGALTYWLVSVPALKVHTWQKNMHRVQKAVSENLYRRTFVVQCVSCLYIHDIYIITRQSVKWVLRWSSSY